MFKLDQSLLLIVQSQTVYNSYGGLINQLLVHLFLASKFSDFGRQKAKSELVCSSVWKNLAVDHFLIGSMEL